MAEHSGEDAAFSSAAHIYSAAMAIHARHPHICRKNCTVRDAAHQIHSVCSPGSVVILLRGPERAAYHTSAGQGGSAMVDQQGHSYGRRANSSYSTTASDPYQFQYDRLGMDFQGMGEEGWSPKESTYHINVLEFWGVWRILQCFLQDLEWSVVMVVSGNTTTLVYIRKQGSTRSRNFDAGDSGPLQLVGGTPDHLQVQAYTRLFEYFGRFTVQGWSDSGLGMVNPSQNAGVHIATLGEAAS